MNIKDIEDTYYTIMLGKYALLHLEVSFEN